MEAARSTSQANREGVSPGGNVGVFDAVTGAPVWTTVGITPQINAKSIFVADVSGDSREEIVVFDLADNTLKIFHNEDAFNRYPSQ